MSGTSLMMGRINDSQCAIFIMLTDHYIIVYDNIIIQHYDK